MDRRRAVLPLIVLTVLLPACGMSSGSGRHVSDVLPSACHGNAACLLRGSRLGAGSRDVSLLVEPNDGVTELVKALDRAQNRILLSAYLLSQHRIVRALERAAAQGVSVYVLLDRYPFGIVQQPDSMFALLKSAGIMVRWAPPYFQYSHAKFAVLDDRTLILSSANFTQAGFSTDRDFVLFDRDPRDVRQADNVFRADWDRIAPVVNDPNVVMSPVGAREKLDGLIDNARHSLSLYSEEVLDMGVIRHLASAIRRGVRVRILTATTSGVARRILNATARHMRSGARVAGGLYAHAKVLIVDGRLAFVGSENLSSTSLDRNREMGLIIAASAVVRELQTTFDQDWGGP